jgi:REP element-mobilizing transposase RayT
VQKHNTGPNALRRGRFSTPGAHYFVTVCEETRRPTLASAAAGILAECRRLENDNVWRLRCVSVMPDHLHLFFTLGNRLTLSQAIARFKTKTRPSLDAPTAWQDNFYDRRLRPDDSLATVIRYIWMNPYVAGLISTAETWPHFFCCEADWQWFRPLTDQARPFPEWLR